MNSTAPSPAMPRTPSFRLEGRRALVTCAGRGIGLAAAVALADAGAHVTLAARSEGELQDACAAIRASGGQCDYLVLDVTDSSAVSRDIAASGPFHVLVNNAGMNRPKELVDVEDQDIDAILDLNVKAAGEGGSIINVSSQMGLDGCVSRPIKVCLEARPGVEPGSTDLQSDA